MDTRSILFISLSKWYNPIVEFQRLPSTARRGSRVTINWGIQAAATVAWQRRCKPIPAPAPPSRAQLTACRFGGHIHRRIKLRSPKEQLGEMPLMLQDTWRLREERWDMREGGKAFQLLVRGLGWKATHVFFCYVLASPISLRLWTLALIAS